MCRSSRLALTRLDCVVTIILISMLAAVVLPMLRAARLADGETVCSRNIAHLMRANRMYAAEYAGHVYMAIPITSRIEGPAQYIRHWSEAAWLMLPEDPSVFDCPTHRQPKQMFTGDTHPRDYGLFGDGIFSPPDCSDPNKWPGNYAANNRLSDLTDPHRLSMIHELNTEYIALRFPVRFWSGFTLTTPNSNHRGNWNWSWNPANHYYTDRYGGHLDAEQNPIGGVHNGKSVFGFVDGHIESIAGPIGFERVLIDPGS